MPNSRPWPKAAQEKARARIQERIAEYDAATYPKIAACRKEKLSMNDIAKAFNALQIPTPRGPGNRWSAGLVSRIIRRNET